MVLSHLMGRFGRPQRLTRRSVLQGLGAVCSVLWVRPARASSIVVPLGLQAKLLAKVAGYDRNMRDRAGRRVLVLIAETPDDPASERAAARLRRELRELDDIAGLPYRVRSREGSIKEIAEVCKKRSVDIVYLTPGFGEHVGELAQLLDGESILSVSAVPEDVPEGAVLGFDLESGKPKIVINLERAKAQSVSFSSRLLKIARVYR